MNNAISYAENNKGGRKLIHRGYMYTKKSETVVCVWSAEYKIDCYDKAMPIAGRKKTPQAILNFVINWRKKFKPEGGEIKFSTYGADQIYTYFILY